MKLNIFAYTDKSSGMKVNVCQFFHSFTRSFNSVKEGV